ncbi:hypothetical protein GCM10023214_04320 [Amycolatopsis dongchuanensis]|uniref:Uncharacterized protein n=1 Tax=Amycolatopsis dongchuanensis TaxID=1070866 RepID=A0ABP9PUP9_9PSEU
MKVRFGSFGPAQVPAAWSCWVAVSGGKAPNAIVGAYSTPREALWPGAMHPAGPGVELGTGRSDRPGFT